MMSKLAPQTTPLRLALCQIETHTWDLAGNLARLRAALEAAALGGAHLVITPECVLNGYPDHTPENRSRWLDSALTLDGPELAEIRALVARLGLHVVLGFAERNAIGSLHNTAVHLTPDGEVALAYRKVHCRNFESTCYHGHFTPGSEFAVSTLRLGNETLRLGLMICFDREVVESVRCLRALGADLIACPLATDTSDLFHPSVVERMDNEQITRARAAENEVPIAVINHAKRFNGGSFVVGPMGEPIVQLGSEAEVRVIDLSLNRVHALHAEPLGWMGWGYRRPAVYRPYLNS